MFNAIFVLMLACGCICPPMTIGDYYGLDGDAQAALPARCLVLPQEPEPAQFEETVVWSQSEGRPARVYVQVLRNRHND